MALTEYNKKRSFSKTPEPSGTRTKAAAKEALSFVVQKHDARRLHYDFRLELDGVLKSWAVPKGPSMNPEDKRLAMMTEDHPLSYADFEGTIPEKQYGAGDVIVWDNGVYLSADTLDPEESRKKLKAGLHKGELSFVLLGNKLKGKFSLVKMRGKEENAWLLVKAKDEYATKDDVLKETASVLSGKTLSRDQSLPNKKQPAVVKRSGAKRTRKRDPMPHKVRPMLAKLVAEPFDRTDWLFEVKWDGYRAIAELERGKVQLYSRNGISFSKKYPPIVEALSTIDRDCVIDGEIIALKNGHPDFHTLQRYRDEPAPLQYVVFDLLYLDGRDLRDKPLTERKQALKELLPQHEQLVYSEHAMEQGIDLFKTVTKEGLEGMIAKDSASRYHEGTRSDAWLKIKSFKEQEAIIIGFTAPQGSRKRFGALVLGAYDGDELRYIGHSGGGFSDRELGELHEKLSAIVTSSPSTTDKVPVKSSITWIEPKYVCQVRFSEWTKSGRMRHPIYAGLRIDKEPREVVKETPEAATPVPAKASTSSANAQVPITNESKVFWPEEGYTKGDVIEYYDRMADTLLPYFTDRPQNLNRHPNGISGKNFYQKNMTMELPPFVTTQKIWSESNDDFINYVVCNNKETLLYLANLGCIEMNPWNSRVGSLDQPDYMILDLDPNGRPFEDLITVAKEVRHVLELACEEHYPKTSGKTGIHIVVPLNTRYNYDDIRTFAELIMHHVHQRVPELTSLERSPKKRQGKIYLDYLQNRFGQTVASAYSLRPYPGATVSTPLEWREVRKGLDPAKFTIRTIWKRLEHKGDLWQPVLGNGVDLRDAIRCLEEMQ